MRAIFIVCALFAVFTQYGNSEEKEAILRKELTSNMDRREWIDKSRQQSGRRKINWEIVKQIGFEDDQALNQAKILDNSVWQAAAGKLWAVGGKRNRAILLTPSGLDPVRIEFEAILYPDQSGRICDITVLLNTVADEKYWGGGYALTTGSYWNNCTLFFKLGKVIARAEYTPLVPETLYHVAVEFDHGHISYWIDDHIVLEIWDENPLRMDAQRWIGIRDWATRMAVSKFVVLTEKQ